MSPLFRRGATLLWDLLFPPCCPLCRQAVDHPHHLCTPCRGLLPPPPPHLCLRCGELLAREEDGCGNCLGKRRAPDATFCAFSYEQGIRELVTGFKFGDHPEWAPLLGELMWSQVGSWLRWESPDLVMPVPLHPWRLITRRYNQSALLAGALAQRLQRPLVTNGLYRIKMTAPQARLQRTARLANPRGAFRAEPDVVHGKSLLLVDDVITTGATVTAVTATLKGAGARRVAVACLARTGRDHKNQALQHQERRQQGEFQQCPR